MVVFFSEQNYNLRVGKNAEYEPIDQFSEGLEPLRLRKIWKHKEKVEKSKYSPNLTE